MTEVEIREDIRMLREAQGVVKDVAARLHENLMKINDIGKPKTNLTGHRHQDVK